VLTSLNNDDLEVLGFRSSLEETVLNLARLAQDAGATGVVASPQDIVAIREACGQDFVILTPGIRGKAELTGDDQKRTLTAGEAIRRGADYLVVGRPIRMAADPVGEACAIVREMSGSC
jgi:orotidine-5'-phosphate decarboxylase